MQGRKQIKQPIGRLRNQQEIQPKKILLGNRVELTKSQRVQIQIVEYDKKVIYNSHMKSSICSVICCVRI